MAKPVRVFLSSTGGDLDDFRDAIHGALAGRRDTEVVRMEDVVAQSAAPRDYCAEEVRASDILVGLTGFRYGSSPAGRAKSFTQLEYEEALAHEVACLMHVAPEGGALDTDHGEEADVRARLDRFRQRIMRAQTTARPEAWSGPDDLAGHVRRAIDQEIARLLATRAPGFTPEKYDARLRGRLAQILALLAADDADRAQLAAEKTELEHRLDDIDDAFAAAQDRIRELERLLEREGNHLGSERLDRAERALADGDFDEASVGAEHLNTATHTHNLAKLMADLDRFEVAEALFRRVLEIDAATIGTA